ncbi:hypothetical protein [Marinagarivorans algicola]|uniref:hypothetical protein n=1 Tax=Marinagarivorans algicola TaxID=1513270 RepID=UPI0006B400BF|nr:hypothetical protein [Marinagarivorans algicola]
MDYVSARIGEGNKIYLLSAILAHNLTRELQMIPSSQVKTTQEKRPTLWQFKILRILRRQLIERAGRIIQSQGKLVLSMAKNDAVKDDILHD